MGNGERDPAAGTGGIAPSAGTGGAGSDAATSGAPKIMPLYASGTRIKMRVGRTADGAVQHLGWRDTQRNEDCSFLPIGDTLRCLPAHATASSYFADSGCSIPAVTVPRYVCPQGVLPTYIASHADSAACGGLVRIFAAGTVSPTGFTMVGNNCLTASAGAELALLSAGAEVPLSSFAEMTVSVE